MDIIEAYLDYKAETEPPVIYHRWSMITCIAALLGRKYYFPFGSNFIYPNLYTMLIGGVGTRKSTAIKDATKLIGLAGYKTFSARKTSKEKFLVDLEGLEDEALGETLLDNQADITTNNLFGMGDLSNLEPKEMFIAADEFNEFTIGDKLDFYGMLGDLWDWDRTDITYTYKIKGSKRGGVSIYQPTINLLGGNTPENFARAFPPEIIGQGFMSRMLIILGEPSGRKYHIPKSPDPSHTKALLEFLSKLHTHEFGLAKIHPDTEKQGGLLWSIYNNWINISDVRFRNYGTRRYTQLIKLCLIHSAARLTNIIDDEIVIYSNTVLAAAEINMSKALGEFGKNKDSDVVNTVLTIIREANRPLNAMDIFKAVKRDVRNASEVHQILNNLHSTDLIHHVKGRGYLPMAERRVVKDYVDFSLLTEEEKGMLML